MATFKIDDMMVILPPVTVECGRRGADAHSHPHGHTYDCFHSSEECAHLTCDASTIENASDDQLATLKAHLSAALKQCENARPAGPKKP